MRVLHIINAWGTGGVETNLLNYCEELRERGIDIDIYARRKISSLFDKRFYDCRGIIYVPTSKGFFPFNQIQKFFQLLSIIKREKYDIVHINGGAGDSLIFGKLIHRKFPEIKIIVHCHTSLMSKNAGLALKIMDWYGKKYCMNCADFYIACSQLAGKWLFSDKILKSNIYKVINYSIDTTKFCFDVYKRMEIRNKLDAREKTIIGTVGRIEEQKNPEFIVKIIKEVVSINENILFLWVGTGQLEQKCKELACKYKILSNIVFYGSSEEIPALLSAMDIFLLPSIYEGLGIVLIEAQASGLPCVISDAIPREVDISNLIHRMELSDTAQNWARKIISIVNASTRGPALQDMSQLGFNKSINANKIFDVYRSILS